MHKNRRILRFDICENRISLSAMQIPGTTMITPTKPESSPPGQIYIPGVGNIGNPPPTMLNPMNPAASPVRDVPTDTSVPADLQTPSPFGGHSMLV